MKVYFCIAPVSTVRTLPSSRSTTPDGLSLKPVKSLGELKYMRTLSRNTNLRARETVA